MDVEVQVLSRAQKVGGPALGTLGRVAQLVRASRLHREGLLFESGRAHRKRIGRGSSVVEHISEKNGVVSSILTRGTLRASYSGYYISLPTR